MMSEAILEMQHIAKAFSGIYALKDAQLTLHKGSVMALVGENGAGKSTLMRILTGIYDHDGGTILYKGQPVHFKNAMQAREAGIAIIHQEFNLFPNLTVAENIFLGDKSTQVHGLVNWAAMYRRAQELVDSIGGTFSVQEKVQALSVQDQQVAEIVKALAANAEVLIMDEPTSALPESEVQHLFRTIRGLKARGVAIVYVSHRLNEIFEICDDITVLRDGVTAFLSPVAATSQQEVVAQMIGREVAVLYPKQEAEIGSPVFEVEHLSDGATVKDLSFCVRKGEILGLYGLVGSGATECPEALFGLVGSARGTFRMDGRQIRLNSPAQAVENHIAYVPPDRHRQGIIRQLSIRFNLTLAVIRRLCRHSFVQHREEQALIDEYIGKLRIKCAAQVLPAPPVTTVNGMGLPLERATVIISLRFVGKGYGHHSAPRHFLAPFHTLLVGHGAAGIVARRAGGHHIEIQVVQSSLGLVWGHTRQVGHGDAVFGGCLAQVEDDLAAAGDGGSRRGDLSGDGVAAAHGAIGQILVVQCLLSLLGAIAGQRWDADAGASQVVGGVLLLEAQVIQHVSDQFAGDGRSQAAAGDIVAGGGVVAALVLHLGRLEAHQGDDLGIIGRSEADEGGDVLILHQSLRGAGLAANAVTGLIGVGAAVFADDPLQDLRTGGRGFLADHLPHWGIVRLIHGVSLLVGDGLHHMRGI